ncbi:hypothetical protein ES703_37549 [subsurface metagenome]
MELKTVYFENPGRENTEAVLRIVKQRAEELGINTILVASTKGNTALLGEFLSVGGTEAGNMGYYNNP